MRSWSAALLLTAALRATSAFSGERVVLSHLPAIQPPGARHTAPTLSAEPVSLFRLIEERNFQGLVRRARDEPSSLLEFVKEAGIAGGISYTVVELTFFAIALPIGYFSWHASTGEWLQPLLLLREDGVEGKARLLGLLLSYIVLLKSLFPVRLGSTLLLTPYTKRFVDSLPAASELWPPSFANRSGGARVRELKAGLLQLADASRSGVLSFEPADQVGFDQILEELQALNPTSEPARSPLFFGEWECRWTSESEVLFAAEKGLLGLPWLRTLQTVNVAEGTLRNTLEFEVSSLFASLL